MIRPDASDMPEVLFHHGLDLQLILLCHCVDELQVFLGGLLEESVVSKRTESEEPSLRTQVIDDSDECVVAR